LICEHLALNRLLADLRRKYLQSDEVKGELDAQSRVMEQEKIVLAKWRKKRPRSGSHAYSSFTSSSTSSSSSSSSSSLPAGTAGSINSAAAGAVNTVHKTKIAHKKKHNY